MMDTAMVFVECLVERNRQMQQWGFPQNKTDAEWLTILVEELGEAAKELAGCSGGSPLISGRTFLKEELIQVMAVCHAWLQENFQDGRFQSGL